MRGVNLLAAVLQQNRYGRKVAYTASILLFTLSACTVFPLSFDGSGAQATSGFSVPATPVITLSTTNNTATVDITVNNGVGVFASSTAEGTANFDVTTDNATGYTLSIVADDNAGLLSDDSGAETHTIASISDKLAESAFNNSAYNNKWGYKPNKYYDITNNQTVTNIGSGAVYLPSPTTVATTLDKTSAANAEGNEYTIALGVRADYGTVDGTYTNTFNLIATGNPVPYIIAYNKNTNDTVTNMPITQSSSTNADYVALASETPVRNDHIFLGWCPSQPTNSNGIDICSGTVYQPGDDYGLDHTTTTNDTLYAMWQSGTTRTYLQDITPESCPSQPTVVFDTRDGEPYTIQKLADGNCWMLDNLRLGNGSTTVALTPADTNITSNFTLPASVNQDFNDYTQPQINTDYETRSAFYGVTGEGKVGTYYNFCAATAGTYCAPIGESTGTPTDDICPKGWRLPTGGETGEYQTLYAAYADYAEFKNALRSPLSGYFKYAEVNHIGSYGSFWSSTPVGDDRMYSLDVRLASVPSDFTSYRTAGISIRCVKEGPGLKMQDVTISDCPTGGVLFTDERDGEKYYIQKIRTGDADLCWMTSNLNLAGGTVLTSDDSNIEEGTTYTLPAAITEDDLDISGGEYVFNYDKDTCDNYDYPCSSFYSFDVATAGSARDIVKGTASFDICPKGWRLPTNLEYVELTKSFSTFDELMAAPWYGEAMRAYWDGGPYWYYGQEGYYWSSSVFDEVSSYSLHFGKDYSPQSSVRNMDGRITKTTSVPVRCVTGTMAIQDISIDTCPANPTIVYDRRDGNKYTIQKLEDGNCWLLDNLRLGGDSAKLLTPETTNIKENFSLPASINANFYTTTSAQINNDSEDILVSYGNGENKVGIYYNYCAASAGTHCYQDNIFSQETFYDICPAGWRMPTGGDNGEYKTLRAFYHSDAEFRNALRASASGSYSWDSSSLLAENEYSQGIFWSSTSVLGSGDRIYSLNMYNGNVGEYDEITRDVGASVRCIIKEDRSHDKYIQDVSVDNCPVSPTVVYDKRDNRKYTVQKLADGNCWMLDNLQLGDDRPITLTPLDSNVSSDYTLPASSAGDLGGFSSPQIVINNRIFEEGYGNNSEGSGRTGTYYNYCAASAGTVCTDTPSSDAKSDICPKGWHLPTGGPNGQYSQLYSSYNNDQVLFRNALKVPLAGVLVYNSTASQGSYGYLWSSTVDSTHNSNHMYLLMTGTASVDVATYIGVSNDYGAPVRCVSSEEAPMIQTITGSNCPANRTLVHDSRDPINARTDYYIQKLTIGGDTRCWMLTDLNLAGGTTISSDDSNIATGTTFTLPASDRTGINWDNNMPALYNSGSTICGEDMPCYSYYNQYAATAGSQRDGNNNYQYDICPKGWRLPNKTEAQYVVNDFKTEGAPFLDKWNKIPSGMYDEIRFYEGDSEYWTSLRDADLRFGINDDNTIWGYAGNYHDGADALVIRCVNKESSTAAQNVHYDANGGTGAMTDATDIVFSTITAASNGFTRTGYEFTGWNTSASGTGTSVAEGDSLLAAATAMGVANGGTLTLYAQWSPVYSISYDGNNSDAGTMTNVHNNVQIDDSIGLIASNYSRAGYGFAGWSLDADAGTKLANGQSVTVYGPNQAIKVTAALLAEADAANNVTLYAVWLPQDDTYTMQTFGATQCNAMTANSVIALKDIRDNEVYTVAKLGDGHCWMTENLRINPATANITADNTNGPTQAFLDGLATAADSTTLCNTNGSACDDTIQYNLNNLNRNLTATPSVEDNSSSWYAYGGMYNWFTATAGNGLYSQTSGSVTGDICPTGWRLPTGGNSGEYKALNVAINGNKTVSDVGLVSFPANFVYSGDYNHDTSGGRGRYARLWSATATSNANSYRMGVAPAEVTPLKNWNKWDGFAVRCFVK